MEELNGSKGLQKALFGLSNQFQHDFFTGQFERFEELLTEHFYHQAIRII
jgi:hypothetical protein